MIGRARQKRRGVRTRHGGRPLYVLRVLGARELTRVLELADSPCAVCGAGSVAEHFNFATNALERLCKAHKDAALRRDLA